MKRRAAVLHAVTASAVVVAGTLAATAQGSGTRNTRAADEMAIRENVRQMETGWNTKSGDAFARPFTEDADFVNLLGMHTRGRAAIARGHQEIFDTIFKNSTANLSVKQIRFLRPDVALVHATGRSRTQQGDEVREWQGIATLVMVREQGEWRIAALQNTQVSNPPRN